MAKQQFISHNADDPPVTPATPVTVGAARSGVLITFDLLWTLVALALIGCFITLVPTPPNDFWWHLRAGQLVASSGVPTTNLFAWTLPRDTPYVYATWLGEWLFYQLYAVGGLQATALARNLLGLAGFALVAVDERRRSGSWRLAALAALLAGMMTINNLIIRTQNWSWVPFGLFAALLSAYAAGRLHPRWLAALPALMAFWVNAHGAFVLGLVMVAIYAAGESARLVLGQAGRLTPRRLLWLYLALAGCVAATLANPLGAGIFGYVVKLLTDPPSQGLINEWQPPTTRSLAGMFFYISLLALMAALALGRRRPTITDTLLVCAFAWQAWNGQRYVVWFGMIAMPILAQCLASPRAKLRPAGLPLANGLLAACLALVVVICQPPLRGLLPFPRAYTALFAPMPGAELTFSASTPVAASAWLRAHQPGEGRLFNEMGYGSYLIWAVWPEAQVFIDPRVELYPLAQWQDYQAVSEGRDVEATLARYGVTRVMLDRHSQPRLSQALGASSSWQREYQDAQSEIYRRRPTPNQEP
jgi:hypothetical protein